MTTLILLNERMIKAADIERTRSDELDSAARHYEACRTCSASTRLERLRLAAVKYTDARHHRKRCQAAIVKAEARRLTS